MHGIDKRRVAADFDAVARHYEQQAVLQRTVAERLVERLDVVSMEPEDIIDIGSGSGLAGRLLAAKYRRARILQLDLSRQMLIVSRRRSPRFFSRQRFVCGDADKLPVKDATIDLAFSSLTLQWCNNLDQCLAEVNRVLRPGGLFMFTTLGPDTLKELRESWASVDDGIHVNTFFDMHDIGDALVRAGMVDVVMDVETLTMTYAGVMEVMRELKALGAQNANYNRPRGLTGKGKLQQVIAAYEKHRQCDGRLPATYEIVAGHAWKTGAVVASRVEATTTYVPIASIQKKHR